MAIAPEPESESKPRPRPHGPRLPASEDRPYAILPSALHKRGMELHVILRRVTDVVERDGAKHEPHTWKDQTILEHIEHARDHLRLAWAGDTTEDHVGHALTRLMFVVQLEAEKKIAEL